MPQHASETTPRSENGPIAITVRLDRDQYNDFKTLAEREHRSVAGQLRHLIERRLSGAELEAAA